MRKATATVVPMLVVFVVLLTVAHPVSARHLASPLPFAYDPPEPNEIPLLVLCILGITEIAYPEDTGFFVLGGWLFIGWKDFTAADRRAAMSQASTTDFFADDVLQKTSKNTRHLDTFAFLGVVFEDVKLKTILWENHDGLSGTHVFTGKWYLDASFFGGPFRERVLDTVCVLTVHFV